MSPDAASLRCPHCGANVPPDAHRCKYCRGRLAAVKCAACFALMFDGAAFCPACGARRAAPRIAEAREKCPGCKTEMQRVAVGGTTLLECAACDGIWMDASDFEQLCAQAEAQAAVLHHLKPSNSTGPAPVKYRPCLRCGTLMNRLNFGQLSGTVVDVCRGHGTFLDAGELHAVVTFVRGGGLERARQRQLQELKDQQWRLAQLERKQAARDLQLPRANISGDYSGIFKLLDLLKD